jgi:alanine dehydrogenase
MALVLRENEVRQLLTMPDTVTVLEQAFLAMADQTVFNLPRERIVMSNGVLNILASASPTLGVLGHKTYTAFREGVRFLVMLYSSQDGQLLSIIEADWLGRMRTGGTAGLAAKYLARQEASIVGLIGAGKQAATQLMGVRAVRHISTVYVYSRTPQKCRVFCEEMSRVLNVDVRPVTNARQAVEPADILITATTSTEPLLFGEWLKQGCHINAIGSNWSTKRELDLSTLQRSDLIITDSLEQAHFEAGDFIIPADEGLFDWNRVYELADIVADQAPQRSSSEDITLFKSLGMALEDIATAAHVYNLARKHAIGQDLPLLS